MKLVVIGGNSREVGKTSLAASLIAATPELRWTALKVTQFGHGICSADGNPCRCAVEDPEHPFAISEERDRSGRSDTSRFLRAGAERALWVRAPTGRLGEAVGELRARLAGCEYVLAESNSLVEFLAPVLYVPLLDFRVADCKASLLKNLDRADAVAVVEGGPSAPRWPGFDPATLASIPTFTASPPSFLSDDLARFVRSRIERPDGPR